MNRTEPLRSDPEKVRAWLQRSREKAIERARGREGQRSSALRRSTAPSDFRDDDGKLIVQRPAAPEEYAAANGMPPGLPWRQRKRRVEARPSFKQNLGACAVCGALRCRREAHHVLPAQVIRRYVQGLRLPEAKARRLLRRLLSDKRNRLPLCAGPFGCHQQFEGGKLVIPRSLLPDSAWEFAAELGDRYVARLERTYPA